MQGLERAIQRSKRSRERDMQPDRNPIGADIEHGERDGLSALEARGYNHHRRGIQPAAQYEVSDRRIDRG